MSFSDFRPPGPLGALWNAVRVERSMPYTLFTFGATDLPYFLIVGPDSDDGSIAATRGEIRITRPSIITPENADPEFEGFFEEGEGDSMIEFLMARGISFPNAKFSNQSRNVDLSGDGVDEIVARLKQRLDDEDEDRVAILTAPMGLGGVALLKYAVEKAIESAPGNLSELRDRGFLN
ncbi:hypothetical protein [Stratiformator vulcanicus]|uniref:Uncharacterized protein n=1 Tax=Stratiformator vulcanicus TaxID=2527980 RepID=A0A517QXQ8_9PLAN|nr:hypothetical protein [Stratiformator vulcanicus]QDT36421.1 hypothetical protein Pan189_07770 [Stratiformator vulcanicus]